MIDTVINVYVYIQAEVLATKSACEKLENFTELVEKGLIEESDLDELITDCRSESGGIFPPTVAIDFDGVISSYDRGYLGEHLFGDPVPGVQDATKKLQDMGFKVVIFTVRAENPSIRKYLEDNGIAYDAINENPWARVPHQVSGKIPADVYIDDRAIHFDGDWGPIPEKVYNFRPWHKR